ncbi:GNAT family N-acetyltransferase [Undibacterium squillarum]|uniref:GNAT family N-acetyltransferase n=1 Tax=Undibacterium squillarum TaxID=1131567 RepID=UPI0035B097EA
MNLQASTALPLQWQCLPFSELSLTQWHDIVKARIAVFVVEQNCPYQEVDGKDPHCLHLMAYTADGELAAYLRIIPPGLSYPQPSLGRVLTTEAARGSGAGKTLLKQGIQYLQQHYPGQDIQIGAQLYLDKFYRSFGFEPVSAVYLEDGIEHQDMLRRADT